MASIQIPQGKTSMTLPDGRVIQFPEGATTVDIPDDLLLQAKEPIAIDKIQAEEQNANPFINQEQQGYNTQVHPMDMEAINKANEPKSFLDTVKDFGTNVLKNFTQPVKEMALPIASATEELTNTFLPESMQTDLVPDLPSKTKENKNTKVVDGDTLQSIENLSRTDLRLIGEATQEQKDKYVNDLAKVVNLGGYNLVQLADGQYKAQNGNNEILDLDAGFYDSMIRGLKADQYEIGGDIAGATIASAIPGGPGKKILATVGGAALGGMIGNQIDNIINSLETGQVLSFSDNLNEIGKAGALSLAGNMGGQIAGKTIESTIDGAKYLKENGLPIGEDKLAQKFVDTKTNINSPENIESANIAKELGATDTKLTQLASDGNAQKAMSDMFENSKEMREAVLTDHDKLTKNLYANGNINKFENNQSENVNDLMGGIIEDQVKGIDSTYKKVFGQAKDDIVEILGDKPLKVAPKTASVVEQKINTLSFKENAAGEMIEVPYNQLDETFRGILDIAKSTLNDSNGGYIDKFQISKMMDLNKELNQYAKLHEDKLTPKHFSVIKEIRAAIDDDITNYANVTLKPEDAKLVKDKWKEINSGYSDWLFGVGKDGNKIDKLLQDTSSIKTMATDMISNGTIDNKYLETFGDIALHLRKTNPNALADLQDTVVNAILQPITVKQKFDGKTFEFIDFDMFEKMFSEKTISTRGLNKIFEGTAEGKAKLDRLKAFRKLAKDEGEIQRAVYKNQSPLSEAGQKAVETKRSFLFGVKYFFTRTLVNAMASKFIPSVAFDKMVIDLSSKQRYTLGDMDKVIRKIELAPEYKSFTPDEKIYLKNLRTQAEDYEAGIAEQTKKRMEEENIKTQQELFEKVKQDADERIKANMLLEHKAIIPPAQIQEGAKEPLGLDIQDRISVANTKQPSRTPITPKETTFNEFTDKLGIDKNSIISKVETEKQFEELKKSPYFDEVVFNGQNTYAKDARNAQVKEGDVRYEKENLFGQGNENGYNKIDASYIPNEKFGTVFTKQDYNNLQAGKIDETLVNKIKMEIAEREHADLLAKEQINKTENLDTSYKGINLHTSDYEYNKVPADITNKYDSVFGQDSLYLDPDGRWLSGSHGYDLTKRPYIHVVETSLNKPLVLNETTFDKVENLLKGLKDNEIKPFLEKQGYDGIVINFKQDIDSASKPWERTKEEQKFYNSILNSSIGNKSQNQIVVFNPEKNTKLIKTLTDNIAGQIQNDYISKVGIAQARNNPDELFKLLDEKVPSILKDQYNINLKQEFYSKTDADLLAKEQFDKEFAQADKNDAIPFSHPVAGGGAVGAASGTQTDYNQDGKVDELDVAIGAVIGSIGIKKTMQLFPKYFK